MNEEANEIKSKHVLRYSLSGLQYAVNSTLDNFPNLEPDSEVIDLVQKTWSKLTSLQRDQGIVQ